jgi:hypothetical protein
MADMTITAEIERLLEGGLPDSARKMVRLHLKKPWVPNFLSVAIAPAKPGLEDYLGPVIVRRVEGRDWHFPSAKWWVSHSQRSHPPDGSGCDPEAHARFLAADAKDPEFLYANVLQSGNIVVLNRADFLAECDWWGKNFRID